MVGRSGEVHVCKKQKRRNGTGRRLENELGDKLENHLEDELKTELETELENDWEMPVTWRAIVWESYGMILVS